MYGQKSISQSLLDAVNTAMFEDIHPQAQSLLKHIKPEHHSTYKPFLAKGTFNGSHKDKTDVLNAAKQAGHLVSENIEEGFKELMQDVKDRAGPQPKGHIGQKAGTRYGGAGQKDDEREKETERLEKKKEMKKEDMDFKNRLIESLKGNQHKIDKNKNNKIDAHDFKILRAQKEEVEELDELSIGTLLKVKHAAVRGANDATRDGDDAKADKRYDLAGKANNKIELKHRALGLKPSGQHAMEEVEQIDEISTKTLAKAASAASDPDSDYHYGKSHDPQKFADHAKKTKDAKSAAAVQGAADAKGHYPRPGHSSGSYDNLAYRTNSRITATGKANKQDVKTLKGRIQGRNEEVEDVNEVMDEPNYKNSIQARQAAADKDFKDRQARLAAAGKETAKDPVRLKRLSSIPGYTAAMDLAKKTTKEEVELDEAGEVKTSKGLTVDTLAGPKKAPKGFEKDNEHTSAKVPLKSEAYTSKELKMAGGIAKDKRYAGGNMTGASNVMDKIKPGLSQTKQAQKALRQANEESEGHEDEKEDKALLKKMIKKSALKTEGKRPESDTVPFVTDSAQSPKERLRAAFGKVKKEMSNGY